MIMQSIIPNKLFPSLGRVVFEFGRLESQLSIAIHFLLFNKKQNIKLQEKSWIVMAKMSFKNKRSLFNALYISEHPERSDCEEFKNIKRKLRKSEEKRNKLLHSQYYAGNIRLKTSLKEKIGVKFDFEEMDSSQIEEIAKYILKATADLIKFYHFSILRK